MGPWRRGAARCGQNEIFAGNAQNGPSRSVEMAREDEWVARSLSSGSGFLSRREVALTGLQDEQGAETGRNARRDVQPPLAQCVLGRSHEHSSHTSELRDIRDLGFARSRPPARVSAGRRWTAGLRRLESEDASQGATLAG